MKISRINPHTNLITSKNNLHNNLNMVGTSSSSKENQVSFNGAILVQAKKIIRKIIGSKKPLINQIEVNDLQKLQKMQAEEVKAELPTATTKLKDRTEPLKWEVRENISGQPIDEEKEKQETTNTKKSTNLLDLVG